MGADDGGIDHLNAGKTFAVLVQRLQHDVPGLRLCPAPEPADRVPCPEMAVQITPCSPSPGDPEHSVQHQPVIARPPPPPWPHLDHERLEERPLRIRHQSTTQGCSPQRTALNQRSGDLGIHFVHTAWFPGSRSTPKSPGQAPPAQPQRYSSSDRLVSIWYREKMWCLVSRAPLEPTR